MKRFSLGVAVLAVLGFNAQIAVAQTLTTPGQTETNLGYTGGYVGGYNPNPSVISNGYQAPFGGPAGALASGSVAPYRNGIIGGGMGNAQINTQNVVSPSPSQTNYGSPTDVKKKPKRIATATQVVAPPAVGTLLSGVGVALSGNTFSLEGQTLLLSGVSAPPAKQVCTDDGLSYRCGTDAEAVLANILSQGQVRCYVDGVGTPLPVRCAILGESVNQAVLYQGR
jgi:endonuclease YncB( thermonuclease family)